MNGKLLIFRILGIQLILSKNKGTKQKITYIYHSETL